MKKIILSYLLAASICMPMSAEKFDFSGYIKGLPDSVKVVLLNLENPDKEANEITSSKPQHGHFSLSGDIKSPIMTSLVFQTYNSQHDMMVPAISIDLMLEPSDMKLTTPISYDSLKSRPKGYSIYDVTLEGGKVTSEYNQYLKEIKEKYLKARAASLLKVDKYFATHANPDTVRLYNGLKKIAEKELLEAKNEFLVKHPEYHISAYETQKMLTNLFEFTAEEINVMANRAMACPDTVRTNKINRIRNTSLRYAKNMDCPHFEATTPDGKVVDFTSILSPGKFTFIDIWASWCGPCRNAIPHVKQLHEKYGDRMEIFSISIDEKEENWRKAMEQENMPWQQYHLAQGEQRKNGMNAFFIEYIPRLLLLDENGKIICSTYEPDVITSEIEKRLGI